MLYVGGYPGIHNKTNISTLYTFVNGQKKYLWQDYKVITNKVINDKWDWNESKTMCGDNYGIIGVSDIGVLNENRIYYLPNRILDEAPVRITYVPQDDQGNNLEYKTCGLGQASCWTTINTSSNYTTIGGIIGSSEEPVLIGDGQPHVVYYFWPDIRVNQRVQLQEYNSFFLDLYNNYDNRDNYTACWMKDGAVLQKKIANNQWKHYYMPYNDLTQCITLSDIDDSIFIRSYNNGNDGVALDTPAGELAYSMDQRKIIYMDGGRVLGVYNTLSNSVAPFYLTVCGRYAYNLRSSYVYCYDMLTDTQVSYSGFSGSSAPGGYISHYHPEAGFLFSHQNVNCRITKFDGLNEPTYINNPFGSYVIPHLYRFRDGKYRYTRIIVDSDTNKYVTKYLDESGVIQTNISNLSYITNDNYSYIYTKYGCWIMYIKNTTNGVTTKKDYYSWDNGTTWTLIP